jgi:hypothetical protein
MQEITDDNGFTLFNHDPDTGRTIWTKQEDGKQVFRIDTPVDKILDANQEHYNNSDGQRFGDWQRVASVPLNLAYSNGFTDAVQQDDHKWLSRFLNNSDNRKFRTFKGNI